MVSNYFKIMITLIMLSAGANAKENNVPTNELLVYKTPTCGCCKKWISHLEDEGFIAHSKDYSDISPVKNRYGITSKYRSCHTAISRNGYAFEGHIPAKFIKRFLAEKHENAIGLAVPAMPLGSPGMEVGNKFTPYNVLILFKDGSSQVYAKVNQYKDQF
ncbi:metal-binding protein [Saccharobesus litoralis]|uniref:Metal-binding protein n=1 Tax=Saccharobesus litoralis TaxID=2172099 RepID=A0A2S0VUN0_9ALTE|nr:DUF411 domain-containing protein [Saccharobesus litoralis]AWB67872.1 metal-binding protein [Saccharobesus litoralis]